MRGRRPLEMSLTFLILPRASCLFSSARMETGSSTFAGLATPNCFSNSSMGCLVFSSSFFAACQIRILAEGRLQPNRLRVHLPGNPSVLPPSTPGDGRPIRSFDRRQVKLKADKIRDSIAAVHWDDQAYIPRTRDLSAGKAELLRRWCDLIVPPDNGGTPVRYQQSGKRSALRCGASTFPLKGSRCPPIANESIVAVLIFL